MISDEDAEKFGEIDLSKIATGRPEDAYTTRLTPKKPWLSEDVTAEVTEPFPFPPIGGPMSGLSEPETPPDPHPLKESLLDGMGSAERKLYPITTGCLDYFRDALLMVAHVSYVGNEQHNPGQPLHWARGKSTDEPDAMGRHLVERGGIDPKNKLYYSAQAAWRALALCQKELEDTLGIKPPRGCDNG